MGTDVCRFARRSRLRRCRRVCGIAALLDPAGASAADAGSGWPPPCATAGPTATASARFGPATLVHTRLAIIDVAGGDQPLRLRGRRRHRDRQRRDLQPPRAAAGARGAGPPLRDPTPTREVVVHGYEQCGPRLRATGSTGSSRFALWDARAQAAASPRATRSASSPLYWWTDGRGVALASEVTRAARGRPGRARGRPGRARPLPGVPLRPRPADAVRGGLEARAGVLLVRRPRTARRGSRATARRPARRSAGATTSSPTSWRERFTDAVERQMMSDVPYGALLSGGVDSAAIVAAMAAASRQPPTTFTIGFPGAGDVLDERAAARRRPRRRSAPTTTTRRWSGRLPRPSSAVASGGSRSRAGCRRRRR